MWWFQRGNRRRAVSGVAAGAPRASDRTWDRSFSRDHGSEPRLMPDDVLIVEDDPIIALDFEDTILGFGVKTIRTAGNVARALEMIAVARRIRAAD